MWRGSRLPNGTHGDGSGNAGTRANVAASASQSADEPHDKLLVNPDSLVYQSPTINVADSRNTLPPLSDEEREAIKRDLGPLVEISKAVTGAANDPGHQKQGQLPGKEKLYEGKPTSFWVAQMKDASWRARVEAVGALEVLGPGDKDVIPALIRELVRMDRFDDGCIARQCAATALGRVGAKQEEAIRALVERILDVQEDRSVVVAAIKAVGKTRESSPAVVGALLKSLEKGGPEVRLAALEAMSVVGQKTPAVVGTLVNAMDDPKAEVQVGVAKALDRVAPGTWE